MMDFLQRKSIFFKMIFENQKDDCWLIQSSFEMNQINIVAILHLTTN